jgi:uncharacterized membrane protein
MADMPTAKIFAHLHPMLVHFPIALVMVAVLFEWIALLRRAPAYGPATRGLLICAMLGAAVAVFSGLSLVEDDDVTFIGEGIDLIQRHKTVGIIGGCTALVLVVGGEIHRRRARPATKVVYLLLLHVTAAAIAYAGALGGESHWPSGWLPW